MSIASAVRIAFETVRGIDFADIPADYTPTNPGLAFYVPAEHPIRILKINNTTDANIVISFDQLNDDPTLMNDHDYFPAASGTIYDYGTNHAQTAGLLEQPMHTPFFIRYDTTPPTKGIVTITVIYASNT